MIAFKNKVSDLLPYDRRQYLSRNKWYGVSFQLPGAFEGKEIGLKMYLDAYKDWFKKIIGKMDDGLPWIINHDFLDEAWFPNNEDNLTSLRTLFKKNNISNEFTGALLFPKEDLLEFTDDLITYPYSVLNNKNILYNNLDISHSELQFVIKISGHLNIDLLTTNKVLLRDIVNENSFNNFIIKQYRGTNL